MTFHCGRPTALIEKRRAKQLLSAQSSARAVYGRNPHSYATTRENKTPSNRICPQHLDFDKALLVSVADFMLAGKSKRPSWLGHNTALKNALSALGLTAACTRPIE